MKKITVEILNWEKYQTRTHDLKRPFWFAFAHDFFDQPDIFEFTVAEKLAFVYALCCASKVRNSVVQINIAHGALITGIKEKEFESCFEKAEQFGMFVVTRPGDGRDVACTIQDKTIQDNTKQKFILSDAEILGLYETYPKKVGKASGNAKLKRIIKNKTDLENFKTALANYVNLCQKENRELKFIKNWGAFVNQHLDFVEVELSEPPQDKAAATVEHFIELLNKRVFDKDDWVFYNFWKIKFNCDKHAVKGGHVKPEFKKREWVEIARKELKNV